MTKLHDMTTLSMAGEEAGKALLAAARRGDEITMRRGLKEYHDLVVANAPKGLAESELTALIQTSMHPVICMTDEQGNTALHLAASHADQEQRNALVRIMVEAGADMGVRNKNGKTPLEMVPKPRGFVARLTGKREQAPTGAVMGAV